MQYFLTLKLKFIYERVLPGAVNLKNGWPFLIFPGPVLIFLFFHFGKRLLKRYIRGELALALLLYDTVSGQDPAETYQLSIVSVLKPSHWKYRRRNWPLLKTIISTFKTKWREPLYLPSDLSEHITTFSAHSACAWMCVLATPPCTTYVGSYFSLENVSLK